MKVRIIASLSVFFVWSSLIFLCYWMGGGDFERSEALGFTTAFSLFTGCAAAGITQLFFLLKN